MLVMMTIDATPQLPLAVPRREEMMMNEVLGRPAREKQADTGADAVIEAVMKIVLLLGATMQILEQDLITVILRGAMGMRV